MFKNKLVLGIESSCDETAAAVLYGKTILSNVISSQIDIHKRFGGVVPEVASRNHTLAIIGVIDDALKQANVTINQIELIAVTSTPGLVGALMVGVITAEALALAHNIPLVKVNHIESHICAGYINNDLTPPFLALVASGGHTSIIDVADYNSYNLVLATTDDAIGEAFDKVARLLGLAYPGGPNIDRLSKQGTANIQFMRHKGGQPSLSYSGLKTAVNNYIHKQNQAGIPINAPDIAASFNKEAVDMLTHAVMETAQGLNRNTIVLSGGVASNSYLRTSMTQLCDGKYTLIIPKPIFCTDNAVMVALRGLISCKD